MQNHDINHYLEELKKKSKSKYITQSVTFNKENKEHMDLLQLILTNNRNFSAFARALLQEHYAKKDENSEKSNQKSTEPTQKQPENIEKVPSETIARKKEVTILTPKVNVEKPKNTNSKISGFF